jgi:hypothetical protein
LRLIVEAPKGLSS